MPRLQVYLPLDLYKKVKQLKLSPSELLQRALREEIERVEKTAALDELLEEAWREVGEPTAKEKARARALVDRINKHLSKRERRR